jgi:hypothetical protein
MRLEDGYDEFESERIAENYGCSFAETFSYWLAKVPVHLLRRKV